MSQITCTENSILEIDIVYNTKIENNLFKLYLQ